MEKSSLTLSPLTPSSIFTCDKDLDRGTPSHAQESATMTSTIRSSQRVSALGYSPKQILTMTKKDIVRVVSLYGEEALSRGYSREQILIKAQRGVLVGEIRNIQRALDLKYPPEQILTMTQKGVLGSTVQDVKMTPWAFSILSRKLAAWLRSILKSPRQHNSSGLSPEQLPRFCSQDTRRHPSGKP